MTQHERSSQKETATTFLRFVVAGKIREAYAAHVADDLRHHNMYCAGDAAALEKSMVENHAAFPNKTLEVRHVLQEGDLVAVHSHIRLKPGDPGIATVHIFRFASGRITEMWDIGQPVPEVSPNTNGMF